jgi:hypothetical protein
MNRLTPRVAAPQPTQRLDDAVHPVRRIAYDGTPGGQALVLGGRTLTIGGAKRIAQMVNSMIAIQDVFTNGPRGAQIGPVVRCPIRYFDPTQIRTLAPGPHHCRAQLPLERGWVGLRPPRHAPRLQTRAHAVIIRHGGTAHFLLP